MKEIFKDRKKRYTIIESAVLGVLFIGYLYALFQRGIWYQSSFLYQQSDGSFAGSDGYADYRMKIQRTNRGTDILFAVNETEKDYQIIYKEETATVKIYEDDREVFEGSVLYAGDICLLKDENGDTLSDSVMTVTSTYSNYLDLPDLEELFPNYAQLYNWSVMKKTDIRGNIGIFVAMLFMAGVLVIDIIFPDFFFLLEHRLAVDGGEPSDWYRTGQKIGRIVIGAAIAVCAFLTFTIR